MKDFLSHRRRNQPGWQLSQAEVDLAADLLAPCCRLTPRLICQATAGVQNALRDTEKVDAVFTYRQRPTPNISH